MSRRNWKRVSPTSMRHSLELCKDYALERHNLSVDRIAERMGLPDKFIIYKWLQTARMPAVLIPAYEAACGIDFITHWLAAANNKLLIAIPTGRKLKPNDVADLQAQLHQAVGALMEFYAGDCEAETTLAGITQAMESLAWHRGNVDQHQQPQLEFGDNDE